MSDRDQLLRRAAEQERMVRDARYLMESAIRDRNATVALLRASGASYGEIANALELTRAGAIGICRKLETSGEQGEVDAARPHTGDWAADVTVMADS